MSPWTFFSPKWLLMVVAMFARRSCSLPSPMTIAAVQSFKALRGGGWAKDLFAKGGREFDELAFNRVVGQVVERVGLEGLEGEGHLPNSALSWEAISQRKRSFSLPPRRRKGVIAPDDVIAGCFEELVSSDEEELYGRRPSLSAQNLPSLVSDAGVPVPAFPYTIVRTLRAQGASKSLASIGAGIAGATATMLVAFSLADILLSRCGARGRGSGWLVECLSAWGGFAASLVAGSAIATVGPKYPVTHATVLGSVYTAARAANTLTRPGEEGIFWALVNVVCYIPGFYLSAARLSPTAIAGPVAQKICGEWLPPLDDDSLVDALAAKRVAQVSLLTAIVAVVVGTMLPWS